MLRGIHNPLLSFRAKLGYSRIKIDHIADSLLKLQIKIGVHLINVEQWQLLTLPQIFQPQIFVQLMKMIAVVIQILIESV